MLLLQEFLPEADDLLTQWSPTSIACLGGPHR